MNFSKSKYKQLCRCPRLLWLETYRHDLGKTTPAAQSGAETGIGITRLARTYFGEYTDVTVMTDGRPDLATMTARTAECLDQGVENICEASFLYNGLYCAVDILHKEEDGYAIYEVKSGTKVTDGAEAPSVLNQFDVDVAYQKYVLEHCGVRVTGVYILCLDSGYVRGEELDVTRLFRRHDMSPWVREHLAQIPERLAQAQAILAGPEPDVELCEEHCGKPGSCRFWACCAAHVPEHSVFDLYRMDQENKWSHYKAGHISFDELKDAPGLNEKQARQVRFALEDCGTHIDRKGIAKFLKTLSYPLYFLDFESMQPAVPEFPGTRPYDQIPFQYSLHYIEEKGGELKHREFLAVSGEDPRRAIAESLCRDIPANVCVTAYNRGFERSRIKELAEQFPDLREHLMAIHDHILDLLTPFQSGSYYNRAMGGSFSIKSVLPALFPDDPELDYHNLQGVHNGTEAMSIFPRIKDMPPEEQKTARRDLLAYCKLDTYAMVKVWQKLRQAVDEG